MSLQAGALVDSHCHLDDSRFDGDREAVIRRAQEAGVGLMLGIGTGDGPPELEAAVRLAEQYDCVYATVGVHPHDAAKASDETLTLLEKLAGHPKVLALGEVGLDFHYDNSPRDQQRRVFADQLQLARKLRKPVVIHTRDAWSETIGMLEEHWGGSGLPGIMHCFSGGVAEARRCLGLGFYLSFAGTVTYAKATAVQEAAREAPLDRLLVETDAPYLAPAPHRGKRNEPAFVVETARKLAALRGAPLEAIVAATTANFRRLCLPAMEATG